MKHIAVLFGGESVEHDVSIVTALSSVIKPLELSKKYHVHPVYITKEGVWYSDDRLKQIDMYTSGSITSFLDKQQPIQLSFTDGLQLIKPGRVASKTIKIDVVFPAMHGTKGEDGSLMGLLEMAGVPYVGCTQSASVLAMDKVLSKTIAQAHGIPVTRFSAYTKQQVSDLGLAVVAQQCEKQMQYPLFVKPPHLGSSIGISRVSDTTELQNALELALHYDDSVLIEEAVHNLVEVTLPIMGNEVPVPALLESPLTKTEDFFDFETKYMQGGKKGKGGTKGAHGYSEIPANLPKPLYDQAQATGIAVYKALGCAGIARIDMLVDTVAKKVYFNEVNPMPGDLYAHNWAKSGVSKVALVTKLVDYAIERYENNTQTTTFATNYLKQF